MNGGAPSQQVVPFASRLTLGGSTIAAAAGVDPFLSRVGLYLRLKGALPDAAESEAMFWGTRLEAVVLERLAEDVAVLPVTQDAYVDAERPWLVGHPDGFALLDGERGVAEAKTTNRWAYGRSEGIPLSWQAQVQTYMHLTDTPRAVIGALIDGQRFELHHVDRDERAMRLLLERADEFHGFLTRNEVPPFDGHPQEGAAVAAMFPDTTKGRTVRASRELRKVVQELALIREAEQSIATQRARCEAEIKASMGDAEVLVGAKDETLVRWSQVATKRLDTKRLRNDHAALCSEYDAETTSRRFTLS